MADMQGFSPALAVAFLIGVLTAIPAGVESVGVCYGTMANNLPPPRDVVQLYKSRGIRGTRIFSVDHGVLDALRYSGISLILGAGADDVGALASSPSFAASWVATNVSPYYPAVDIRYIAVGNEIKGAAAQGILPAMKYLNAALAAAGLGRIKVSTAVSMEVVTNTYPPSNGAFADPAVMAPIAQYLANTGAPLLENVYPYFAYRDNHRDIQLGYALFRPCPPVRDGGTGLVYTNLFDAMVDATYAALEKVAAPQVRVVVSESGWPSAGGFAASKDNARAYNQGLINHVPRGTPRRPGPIEAFVFAVFNENQKTGEDTERNFGLFYPNKSPVYPIYF